ncbi:MAG: hypothetical protein HQK86_08325 [Nitrospinae bacterium]|nr:hypothetical protein [Nitrospinota bacterium]MBF0634381.1 hypothetical protein [Nitrospinota bacterium]
MKTMPLSIKVVLALNIVGTSLLCVSLLVETPFWLTVTMTNGSLFLMASFALWLRLVIKEAMSKGLLD